MPASSREGGNRDFDQWRDLLNHEPPRVDQHDGPVVPQEILLASEVDVAGDEDVARP